MQLQHTPLSFILTTGLSKIQVFEAITCQLVGGRESSPVPELPKSLKKAQSERFKMKNYSLQGLCVSH